MASLSYKLGRATVQFMDPALGKRLTVRLGKMGRQRAEAARAHVTALADAKRGFPLPPEALTWAQALPPVLRDRVARVGLMPGEAAPARPTTDSLAAMCDRYIKARSDLKPATLATLRQTRDALVRFFGQAADPRSINLGTAGDWRRAMEKDYADGTVSLFVRLAKQFFADAVDRKQVPENPFRKLKSPSLANRDRNRFVPAADVVRVIGACPDAEWRLIFALARFGGLRVQSEVHALEWSNVDWAAGAFVVVSPKMARHPTKARRRVPIFPELLPYLRDCFEQAEPGARFVIARHRCQLGHPADRLIEKAGVARWPRTFQNLRASRQTELAARFPLHVVCEWIGNSPQVAAKHYLMVTADHFAEALQNTAQAAQVSTRPKVTMSQEATETPAILEESDLQAKFVDPFVSREIAQSSHNALQKALHEYVRELHRASARLARGKGVRA